MALGKNPENFRRTPERIMLTSAAFAKWMSKRKGVSIAALQSAVALLSNGIVDALAEGYSVRLHLLGTFEVREIGPQRRYHRLTREMYIARPRMYVHFKKSATLNNRVKDKAQQKVVALSNKSAVPKVKKG